MHQVVFEGWHEPAHARCTRARASFDGGAAGDRRKGRGGHGPSSSVAGALGLRVLTSDPLLELLRGGALSMRDLRALLLCTGSEVRAWEGWEGAASRSPTPLCKAALRTC